MNKKILIAELIATVIASVAIVFYVMNPFGESWTDLERDRQKKQEEQQPVTQAVTDTPTKEPVTQAATEAPTKEPVTPDPPTSVPNPPAKDDGSTFGMDGGILVVKDEIFGLTYSDLNRYFGGKLPAAQSWDWSQVPLTYLDFTYSDGRSYVLYFENNRLIAVREEHEIRSDAIPDTLLNAARGRFGESRLNWYQSDTGKIVEYDWDYVIGSEKGEYAIFLNPYDGINHVCQQYTSAAFTGGSIQSR